MSCANENTMAHIDPVDVNNAMNENNILSELSSDSGVETAELCSETYSPSSDSEISPLKSSEVNKQSVENEREIDRSENESIVSFPASISPDSEQNNLIYSENHSSDIMATEEEIQTTLDNYNDDSQCTKRNFNGDTLSGIIESKSLSQSANNLNHIQDSCEENKINNSNASLNIEPKNEGIISPLSKSAENLTTKSDSTTDLNAEQILSQFQNQKQKAAATQKIVSENPHSTQQVDIKSKIPKEILNQDLGSIVRNVHGIFSSVSGSLKNAYNNQRVTQKPVKPKLQSKVLNDIFEDGDANKIEPSQDTEVVKLDDVLNDAETNDVTKLQVESLERVLTEQQRENASLKELIKKQTDDLQAKDLAFNELKAKVDVLCKKSEQAQREKDAAVMRYASLECTVIEARKTAENAVKAERAAIAEKELLISKLKTAREEKQRICQLYDDKCHDLSNSEKEVAKVREDIKELEGRLKWTQSKLRAEMDAYKESAEKVEKLTQQISELEAAKEAAVTNSTDSMRAKQLEAELKESQAALILRKHEKEDFEKRLNTTLQLLEACKKERDDASASLACTQSELERVRQHAACLEEEAAELAALRAKAAVADTLSSQLQRESELRAQAERALSLERARAATCGAREAAALQHAARLTAEHVAARAAAHHTESTVQALTADNTSLRERIDHLTQEKTKLEDALKEETERRNMETRVLARKVAELTEETAEATKKLEWEKGEVGVLKKKHASAIKELNRELQRALKRIEQLEAKVPQNGDTTSERTGSVTSLSSGESAQEDRLTNGHANEALPDIQTREPDRQTLIERIVQLQRAAARRAERCDFLEEHSRQLTQELRGKSRLLRHLLASLPAQAVATQHADTNKIIGKLTKKEIARLGGGAMAAVWGGDSSGITLELSLEINKKLQAVLEDTLLKNIMLKENIDTLGKEIARLKTQTDTK